MEKHKGGCSCGDVRYHITDEPLFTHACHCKLCQRYTASAFVVHSLIEASNFVAFLSATLMAFVSSFSFHSRPRSEPSGLVKCFRSLAGIRLR